MKTCTKCGIEKSLECFSKKKDGKDGLASRCKECHKGLNKARYTNPEVKERIKKLNKAYRDDPQNKERQKEYDKTRYANPEVKACRKERMRSWLDKPENKERKKELDKAWHADPENKKRTKEIQKEWRDRPENKERKKEYMKAWHADPENKEKRNKKEKARRDGNLWYKLCNNMRTRMYTWLQRNLSEKTISAVRDLGCNWSTFKPHLEALFYSHPVTGEVMSWDNYGLWHLDHIYPLAKVDPTDIDQVKAAFHYTNYQPLWAEENLAKHDKITGPRVVL